ncbi:hypothetical protein JR316_0005118 [Psilocybe cubensis]|uniref:Uncharacterized protein n=1 Tax=Psilocybe cubensis TaxID=181762 RepID=A0ACB8H4U6_PSICU|nr:hypothetical protein JR316_0005118 [Psilocybe cubensis]KAH9483018.1 hypothetical protein JR316_0005118 [Psilocybe cubensis]
METVVENQDSRPLPEGWVQNYEPSYYVQMNVMPPKVSFTHPADLAPAGKQKSASPSSSLESDSRSKSSAAPSPHSSPVPLANMSPQPTASSVIWVKDNSASPPLCAPIPQPVPGSRQLPAPPHSSDESHVTLSVLYPSAHANNAPNAQLTLGNMSSGNGANDNVSKLTPPSLYDVNYQLHQAQALQPWSSLPDHLQHVHQRSQTFAPGQTRQVGHNPNNVVSNEVPACVNGFQQTQALVTHARLPSQPPSFTTVATNPVAATAQSQPDRSRHYTTIATNPVAFEVQPQGNQSTNFTNMATNHVNQMGASPGAVSVGNTGAPSLPTFLFSQTGRVMGPRPPPLNNTSPTFTGSTFANPTSNLQINSAMTRPNNQLANSMGKIAAKVAIEAASGFVSQATGIPTTVMRSVGNFITDRRLIFMWKGMFEKKKNPIQAKVLQAVLEGDPKANYQGVIDALIKQQQELNAVQMKASMAYKPIPSHL